MHFIELFKKYIKEINDPKYQFLKLLTIKKDEPSVNLKKHVSEKNSNLIEKIYKDFTSLDKDLIKIRSSDTRYAAHINYNDEFKIYSKKHIVKNYRIHESINNIINVNKKSVTDNDIINMWKECIKSDLFPKIIEEKGDYILIEYINKNLKTLYDVYNEKNIYYVSYIIKKNKKKLNSYYDKIKKQSLCINDFNFKNFVIDNNDELFMIDIGDIDYTSFFLPEIFLSDYNNQLNIFIFKSIGNENKSFYEKFIYEYYKKDEINKVYFI